MDEVVELAVAAGNSTLRWFRAGDIDLEEKADGTPVTIADRTAERLIRDELTHRHPGDAVFGEEEGGSGPGGRRWIIDPIDGTLSFIHGVPLYGTLLAVEDEHGIAAGAIHHAALDETVWAGRGRGAFHNGAPCRVSSVDRVDRAVFSTSDYAAMTPAMLQSVHQSGFLLRTWGDAYGYTLVATGRMEAMVDPIVHIWDVAPMAVIIPEAGGEFSSLDGKRSYTEGNAVASNGLLHERVLSTLAG
ncbi:MAG: histidinol phosphate phosphatase [Acidimicrobiia bacterium]|nr:histidinol phosphate phosphatase [Acidimicrobiia bacterium]